jgi:group II intron maturase
MRLAQLLRDKVGQGAGSADRLILANLIDDLNPVIVGWRNYYRYASRACKECTASCRGARIRSPKRDWHRR